MNEVTTELQDRGDRRARLRAKAAAEGMLASEQAPLVAAERRATIIESTRGLGRMADALIAEEREPL